MLTPGSAASSDSPESDDAAYRDFYGDTSPIRLENTAHAFLAKNAIRPDRAPSLSAANLPPDAADLIRRSLKDFAALSVFEKMLLISQWSGQSFSEFGTMKWIPRELKRPQSKQLVSQRWNRLVERFPLAAALKCARPGRIRKDRSGLSAPETDSTPFDPSLLEDLPPKRSPKPLPRRSPCEQQELFAPDQPTRRRPGRPRKNQATSPTRTGGKKGRKAGK